MCSIWHWALSVSTKESLLAYLALRSWKNIFFLLCRFYFTGSRFNTILRRLPSLDWLVSKLSNTNCSKQNHFQTVTNLKQWRSVIEGTSTFFSKKKWWLSVCGIYTGGHVKYNWHDYVINYWFLVTAPVSYQSNLLSELWQSSTGRCWLDVPTNS